MACQVPLKTRILCAVIPTSLFFSLCCHHFGGHTLVLYVSGDRERVAVEGGGNWSNCLLTLALSPFLSLFLNIEIY